MSRSQSTQTFNTASSNAGTDQSNAQNSYGQTQGDISDYKTNLAKFMSSNPYTAGGQYDKTIGQVQANTSDAGSQSLNSALQGQAARTGQNSAADAATAAEAARQNTRDASSSLATAEQTRMGDEAAYNQQGVQDSAVPASDEASLYGTSSSAANNALGEANTAAAANKSFLDTLGQSFAGTLGTTLGGGNGTGAAGAKKLFG